MSYNNKFCIEEKTVGKTEVSSFSPQQANEDVNPGCTSLINYGGSKPDATSLELSMELLHNKFNIQLWKLVYAILALRYEEGYYKRDRLPYVLEQKDVLENFIELIRVLLEHEIKKGGGHA